MWIIPVLIVIIAALVLPNVRVVPQATVFIIERLGKYSTTWNAGLHVKLPFVDRVARKVDMKERVLNFPPQPVITKDNVSMMIDSIVYMTVFDPKNFTYGIDDPITGVENLTATSLRNIVGQMDFDEVLSGKENINSKMFADVEEATNPWGIKINRVEVKSIQPPRSLLEIMEKQMRAEREKRQAILEAEAHKQSAITRAEGDKQAKILAAEAERDAQIALAEGKAKSIQMIYDAEAAGVEKLSSAKISNEALRLKSIEAMKDVADGNSTKIFFPTDIMQSVAANGVLGESLDLQNTMKYNEKVKIQKENYKDPCNYADHSYISKELVESHDQSQAELEDLLSHSDSIND